MLAGSSCTQTISRALGCWSMAAFKSASWKGYIWSTKTMAVDPQFVADFSGTDEDALRIDGPPVGNDRQEALVSEVLDRGAGVRVAQHAFRGEHDQRLAPVAQGLAAQQVEILGGVGGLADLEIVARGQLQEALDAGAGVLRSLPFVAVRQKQHQS